MQGHVQIDGDYTELTALVHAGTPVFFGVRAGDGVLVSSVLEARIVPRESKDEPVSPLLEPSRWSTPAPVACATEFIRIDSPFDVKPYGDGQTVLHHAFASDGRYVYVLRAIRDRAGARAVYVDRFVLGVGDGLLHREQIVRERSDGTTDYVDEQGNPYFAPAVRVEVPTNGETGAFAATLIPTSLTDAYRWQFVACDGERLLLTSIAHGTRSGLTEQDLDVTYHPSGDGPPVAAVVRGRVETALRLASGSPATDACVISYAKHRYLTQPSGSDDETPTHKSEVHALVTFGLRDGTIGVLDFEIANDGLLAAPPAAPIVLEAISEGRWGTPPAVKDDRGLALIASRLAFTATKDTPFVIDGADGYVHLYFTAPDGSMLVAAYDSAQEQWRQSKPLKMVEHAAWSRPGVGPALSDTELLALDSPGLASPGQFRILVENGFYEGHDLWGVPGSGPIGKELVVTRALGQVLPTSNRERAVDACYLGDGRVLFWGVPEEETPNGPSRTLPRATDDTIPWAIWSVEPETESASRGLCGKCLAWGHDLGESLGNAPQNTIRFEVARLGGSRLLFLATHGAGTSYQSWCVLEHDASKTGALDSFPGTSVTWGVLADDLLGSSGSVAIRASVTSLGDERLLFYRAGSGELTWAIWQLDPSAKGEWGSSALATNPGLPGTLIARANRSTNLFGPWPSDGDVEGASIRSLGDDRLLFYRPGQPGWATWALDPAARGILDAPDGGWSASFPGHWIGGSRQQQIASGAVVCLGPSRCLSSPVVIEFGSFATLTGSTSDGVPVPRGPVGAMYRMYLRRTRATQVTASLLRIGELSSEEIGTADVLPTLVGYIEGAPPVPLENLDQNDIAMNGWAPNLFESKVDYSVSKDVAVRWSSSRELGTEARLKATSTSFVGIGIASGEATNELTVQSSYGFLDDSREGVSQSLIIDRSLEISGYTKAAPLDPLGGASAAPAGDSGKQWWPSNFGQAVMTTAKATVFALCLKNGKRPVNYVMVPKEDSIAETLVTFKINPHYVCQGTLDGMMGAEPHPSYPNAKPGSTGNSYFKKDESDALIADIARRGKQAEAYYSQYNANAFAALPDLEKEALLQRSLHCTYEWSAGGGAARGTTRTSVTGEASLGGSFKLAVTLENTEAVTLGAEEAGFGVKVTGKLSFLLGGSVNLTLTKTASTEEATSLTTALKIDGTQKPGRVSAYTYQTFFLEPDAKHFLDFFGKVVDWAWLQGHLEEGEADDAGGRRALLEAVNRPSAAWRILHRVTDVRRFAADRAST